MSSPHAHERTGLGGPLLLAAALTLAFVDILHGYFDHDAGFFFMDSLFIAHGLRPFVDFTSGYFPLFELLNAVPIALGVDRELLIWAVPLFWMAVIALLTQRYSARRTGNGGWFLAALYPLFCIDFGGNHYTLEHGVVVFGLLALLVFERRDSRAYFLTGLCLGGAILCKQVGVLLVLPFATQVRTRREALALGGGLALACVLFFAWLGFEFTKIAISFSTLAHYVDHAAPKTPAALWNMAVWLAKTEWHRTPPGLALLATVFCLGVLVAHRLWRERRAREFLWVAAWLSVGGAYLGARLINWFPHYTLNVWPALVVLSAEAKLVLTPSIRRFLLSLSVLALVSVMLLLLPVLRDVQGMPYFQRWMAPDLLHTRFGPIAQEIMELVPPTSTVSEQGVERRILLFLADRLPTSRLWHGVMTIKDLPEGPYALFILDGQKEASWQIERLKQNGYAPTRDWHLLRETAVLFLRK